MMEKFGFDFPSKARHPERINPGSSMIPSLKFPGCAVVMLFGLSAGGLRTLGADDASVAVSGARGLECEKYALDNGMTVILHVDHALPTAGINLWYRVGARNEPARRSG